MDRVTAINKSLTAFTCGILSFVPLVGVLPGLHALLSWSLVRAKFTDWNPADRYLMWGGIMGSLNLVLNALSLGAWLVTEMQFPGSGGLFG